MKRAGVTNGESFLKEAREFTPGRISLKSCEVRQQHQQQPAMRLYAYPDIEQNPGHPDEPTNQRRAARVLLLRQIVSQFVTR